jgi:hypothetical protein
LADTLSAEDLARCGRKWLARFTPFFTEQERRQAGCQHRLFQILVSPPPAGADGLAMRSDCTVCRLEVEDGFAASIAIGIRLR